MASYIAIFLCLFSLILFTILLIRFKKLFSTDSILDKTKSQMEKMIKDINNQSTRNIDLINEQTRRVRALLSEADQKMEQFKLATDRLRNMIAIVEQYDNKNVFYVENQNVSNIKPVGQIKTDVLKEEVEKEKVYPNISEHKEIPVYSKNLFSEKPILNKKEKDAKMLNEKIKQLFGQGYQVEQIAQELSCSVGEVQLIIDML